jgi:small subunit ribosomal protein S20
MVKTAAAKKRIRLNEERRLANKAKLTHMKTRIKQVLLAIEEGNKEEAAKALILAVKAIDKAAKHHIIHANTAARRKSRIAKAVAQLNRPEGGDQ